MATEPMANAKVNSSIDRLLLVGMTLLRDRALGIDFGAVTIALRGA